uniref:Uncharacterized protein n=1 Tax=Zea mays TaxID=4577 RepID=B6SZZ8_MAIZE|nr:hypothetical protein [Zea mays]
MDLRCMIFTYLSHMIACIRSFRQFILPLRTNLETQNWRGLTELKSPFYLNLNKKRILAPPIYLVLWLLN